MFDNSSKFPNLDPPEDGFNEFCEAVYECFTEVQFDDIYCSSFQDSNDEAMILYRLYIAGCGPDQSAEVLYCFFHATKKLYA